jgi:hypothetical protein
MLGNQKIGLKLRRPERTKKSILRNACISVIEEIGAPFYMPLRLGGACSSLFLIRKNLAIATVTGRFCYLEGFPQGASKEKQEIAEESR